jgi:hypothetical protein
MFNLCLYIASTWNVTLSVMEKTNNSKLYRRKHSRLQEAFTTCPYLQLIFIYVYVIEPFV